MSEHTFTATPVAHGKTGGMASVPIPDDVVEALGGKRVPVTITVNGFTFQTTTGMVDGNAVLGFNTANRAAAGIEAGTPAAFTVARDAAPRPVEVPSELQDAFASHPTAKATWDGLAPSHRREYATWITSAKKAETRDQRVVKALEALDAGKKSYR